MAKIIIEADVITQKFDRAVSRLIALGRKAPEEIVKEAGIAYMQSAAKAVPPKGAGIPAKKFKRPVIELHDPKYPDKRSRTRYKVPYRTLRKRGKKFFRTKSEAKKFSIIKFRGIGKAGFFLGISKLGGSLSAAHNRILSKSPAIKRKNVNVTYIRKYPYGAEAIIINRAEAVGRYGPIAALVGRKRAANRLNKIEKEIRQKWT